MIVSMLTLISVVKLYQKFANLHEVGISMSIKDLFISSVKSFLRAQIVSQLINSSSAVTSGKEVYIGVSQPSGILFFFGKFENLYFSW